MIVESTVLWGMEHFLIRVLGLLIYLSFPVGIKNIQGCILLEHSVRTRTWIIPSLLQNNLQLRMKCNIPYKRNLIFSSYGEISEWSPANTHWPLASSTVMEQQWRRAWVISWCFPCRWAPYKLFSHHFLLSQWVWLLSATTRIEGKWESRGETVEDWNTLDVFLFFFFCIP